MTTTMTKRDCFVFDLDGTVCNVTHRRHWVASKPKNWNAWNAGLVNDTLNDAVYQTLSALNAARFAIVLVSGRGSEYRAQTEKWLRDHNVPYEALYMREAGDFRADDIIKSELADQVEETYSIRGVFDDRKRVVDMWIARGIFVFDVAQGSGDF